MKVDLVLDNLEAIKHNLCQGNYLREDIDDIYLELIMLYNSIDLYSVENDSEIALIYHMVIEFLDYCYIISNCSLLPLAMANSSLRRNRLVGVDKFMLYCTFHADEADGKKYTPSLSIWDNKNKYYCYGCYCEGNIIDYICASENLDEAKAMMLLAKIFLLFPVSEDDFDYKIVLKYRKSILSAEYLEFLVRERKKFESLSEEEKQRHLPKMANVDKQINNINRIRAGIVDSNFIPINDFKYLVGEDEDKDKMNLFII